MTNPEGYAHGPGGLYSEDDHHHLGSRGSAHVDENGHAYTIRDDQKTKLVQKKSGVSKPASPGPGWVTYASWAPASDVTRISGGWTVPEPPDENALEIVFLHIGLKGTSAGQVVFAPIVLQWGKTPYGGGHYWSLACWLQVGSKILVGNYVEVEPGDRIEAELVHTESDTVRQLSMKGTAGGENATLTFSLTDPLEDGLAYGGVLEAYALDMKCSQYPSSPSITFDQLTIEGADGALEPTWQASDEVSDCGQKTEIVNASTVKVFFRSS